MFRPLVALLMALLLVLIFAPVPRFVCIAVARLAEHAFNGTPSPGGL